MQTKLIIYMKAPYLVILILLLSGGLFVQVTSPISRPTATPVRSFAAPDSSSVWWVGASSTDSSALPNMGVKGVIQVVSTQVTGCLAFWVSDDLSNNNWGQVGYYICDGSVPEAFYQVWNLNTNTILTGGIASVSIGAHSFAMRFQSGTTWAYLLDGNVIGTYDMGASTSSSSYPVFALSEEEADSVFAFPLVTFTTAMQVLQSGTWNAVQTAQSYGTAWGISGSAQGGGLQNDQIVAGGSLATLPQGTLLWGGGSSTTTSSASTTFPPVTSTVTVTTTVTDRTTSTQTATQPPTVTQTATTTQTRTQTVTTTATNTATTTKSIKQTITTTSAASTQTVTSTVTVTTTIGLGAPGSGVAGLGRHYPA
ncbi:MAG: hypothetical protein ABSB26_10105 [Nitrososphaerales archaeon]